MKTSNRSFAFSLLLFANAFLSTSAQTIITKPPMGWNSFDSYGVSLNQDAALRNIDELAKRYKQYGYEYFVVDAGWYNEYASRNTSKKPIDFKPESFRVNEYGIPMPSRIYFPDGIKFLADRAHAKGLKFGIHIMRGMPRIAYRKNTKVKGTPYFAKDITDTTSICTWSDQYYGINMTKPGAQEYYNSLINQLANWGIDFIKADDIVPFPNEINAVVKAIAQCGRPIVLSLSPGGDVDPNALETFKKANMLRVTHDIWDEQIGINQCFDAWKKWQGKETERFFIDMDMIPFGELQIVAPKPKEVTGLETKEELRQLKKAGKLPKVELQAGKGWHRQSKFSKDQQLTFITMRALSASPLFIGGDLVSMDDYSYKLLTNKDMLDCNQNGVMGKLVYEKDKVETWKTTKKNTNNIGWIGVFNRNLEQSVTFQLSEELLGLKITENIRLFNIWEEKECRFNETLSIPSNSVIFIKFSN